MTDADILVPACTREGTCCHGSTIRLTPWELALLAQTAGMPARAFRDRHTRAGGTVLLSVAARGGRACSLYADDRGCTVHPARPLACRLFPLARRRTAGQPSYRWIEEGGSCARLCPASAGAPRIPLAAYLAGQAVSEGESAHDGYAAVLAGFISTASSLAVQHVRVGGQRLDELARADGDTLAAGLAGGPLDELVLPQCATPLDRPAAYVDEHRRLLAVAVAGGFEGRSPIDVADILMSLAFLLAPVVGTPAEAILARYRES